MIFAVFYAVCGGVMLGWAAGYLIFSPVDATAWVKRTVFESAQAANRMWRGMLEKAETERDNARRIVPELIAENTRLAGCIQYGQPQVVNRSIDVATSLRLMGLDPGKSQRDRHPHDAWTQ